MPELPSTEYPDTDNAMPLSILNELFNLVNYIYIYIIKSVNVLMFILSVKIHIGSVTLYYSKSSIGCEKLESSSEFLTVEHL